MGAGGEHVLRRPPGAEASDRDPRDKAWFALIPDHPEDPWVFRVEFPEFGRSLRVVFNSGRKKGEGARATAMAVWRRRYERSCCASHNSAVSRLIEMLLFFRSSRRFGQLALRLGMPGSETIAALNRSARRRPALVAAVRRRIMIFTHSPGHFLASFPPLKGGAARFEFAPLTLGSSGHLL
jgi:hypothetical protein